MRSLRLLSALLLVGAVLSASGFPAGAVSFEWVIIDDAGNPPDDQVMSCCKESKGMSGFGSVSYVFRIAQTEVTNAQYAEFLNAVAANGDPNGIFNERSVITRLGTGPPYAYEVRAGLENRPAGWINFFDALRFANWLHNRQPTGLQDETTTEDGAYPLLGANPLVVERKEGATFFVPSEDEWYKAAFWDPFEQRYWDFATGFNPQCPELDGDCPPLPEPPPGGPDRVSANYCPDPIDFPSPINCPPSWPATTGPGEATDVGAYVFSPSPFGTLDQAGNLAESTEGINIDDDLSDGSGGLETRVFRGGLWIRGVGDMSASYRTVVDPNGGSLSLLGLRVATVPEPGAAAGVVALGLVLGLSRRSTRRAAGRGGSLT